MITVIETLELTSLFFCDKYLDLSNYLNLNSTKTYLISLGGVKMISS